MDKILPLSSHSPSLPSLHKHSFNDTLSIPLTLTLPIPAPPSPSSSSSSSSYSSTTLSLPPSRPSSIPPSHFQNVPTGERIPVESVTCQTHLCLRV